MDANVRENLQLLLRRWERVGCVPHAPLTDARIAELEAQLAIRLPEDMRTFYRTMDGAQMDMDSCLRFWRLEELRPEDAPLLVGYYTFADFLIHSHDYAVCLVGHRYGEVIEHDGSDLLQVVAPSFGGFIGRCARDPYVGFDAP